MAHTFIIDEYKWEGHKQILLEKMQGDASGYRVTIVKRCNTLEAAQEAFLQEIPAGRKDYHSGLIEDYALKNGEKTKQTAPQRSQLKLGSARKGKTNAKSNRKTA